MGRAASATPEVNTVLDDKNTPNLLSSSLLEPRVAVVLNVPKSYRPWLFLCRLLSISPAVVWGTYSALELLIHVIPISRTNTCPSDGASLSNVVPFPLIEMALGVMWCGASAYLSFFFTDCLMSRWLINYTPEATIIRLLTINMTNAYVTSWILFLAGGFDDRRLLLPGWISIATTLTICYHITQRKINIRKETSTSINIFSIASFMSMVALLGLVHSRSDYPEVPLITIGKRRLEEVNQLGHGLMGIPHVSDSL